MKKAVEIRAPVTPFLIGNRIKEQLRRAIYSLPEAECALWITPDYIILEQSYDLENVFLSYVEIEVRKRSKVEVPIFCPKHDLFWMYMLQGKMKFYQVSKPTNTIKVNQKQYRVSYLPVGHYRVRLQKGKHRVFYMVHKKRSLFRSWSNELDPLIGPVSALFYKYYRIDVTDPYPIQDGSKMIIRKFLNNPGMTPIHIQSNIYKLSFDLIRASSQSAKLHQVKKRTQEEWVKTIQADVEHGIDIGADLDINIIQTQHRISNSSLNTYFKNVLGVTLGKYIQERKLEKSKNLLEQGLSVNQTATYLNWRPSYFSDLFSKRFGYSPSEHIKRQKEAKK